MKTFATILVFPVCMFASLIASLVITWVVWRIQITDKAFHCTDDNVSGFWCDMDTHRDSGDTLLSTWTWGELKIVRIIYEIVFYILWIGGGLLVFRMFLRLFSTDNTAVIESAELLSRRHGS
jgi:hypothetical protein